jgi:peroxiredoxin
MIVFSMVMSCSEAQSGHSPEVINRVLSPVKEGQTLDDNAWLISENEDTLSYAEQFKGKWLLIDYWTAGCIPCIKEFPHLDEYYQSINRSKLEIISLSVDNKIKRWEKARKKYDFSMPKYYAGTDSKNPFLSMNFQLMEAKKGGHKIVTLTPQYVLISPEGKIIDKEIPKPSESNFSELIMKYINE